MTAYTWRDLSMRQTEKTSGGFNITDYGDSKRVWKVYPTNTSLVGISEDFERGGFNVHANRCTHSYDCCGQWYNSMLILRITSTRVLACVTYRLNV